MRAFPFPDIASAREELERDVLFPKIPEDEIERIVADAWEAGAAAARKTAEGCGTNRSMEQIAAENGLAVERRPEDFVAASMRYFSEYYDGSATIVLHTGAVNLWAQENRLTPEDAEELILSHEYYHFLECKKIGPASGRYRVPALRIGRLVLARCGVRALSEIGAYGFSRTWFDLRRKDSR